MIDRLQNSIRLLLARYRTVVLAGWWIALALVVVASLLPDVAVPPVAGGDKLGHFIAYAVLTAVPVAVKLRVRGSLAPTILFLLALGGGIELAQEGLGMGRDGSVGDAVANAMGVVAGNGVGLWARS